MKILRCIHSLNPVIGGPFEAVKQLSRVIARRGHEVEVVSLDAPTDPWLREFPATVHALGPGHDPFADTVERLAEAVRFATLDAPARAAVAAQRC